MQEEFSAGGIVFRKKNVIPAKAGIQNKASGSRIKSEITIEVLVSQHSGHHGWVFPKGHVGDTVRDETKEEAAIREVKEETGIIGKIVQPLPLTDYWYYFQGQKRHKTVQYFLMEYESGNIQNHGWEMENVVWLSVSEVENRLTFDGDKKVWEKAKQMINKQISK